MVISYSKHSLFAVQPKKPSLHGCTRNLHALCAYLAVALLALSGIVQAVQFELNAC